jgi:hypothetical protein
MLSRARQSCSHALCVLLVPETKPYPSNPPQQPSGLAILLRDMHGLMLLGTYAHCTQGNALTLRSGMTSCRPAVRTAAVSLRSQVCVCARVRACVRSCNM